jgi:hypothetical protein
MEEGKKENMMASNGKILVFNMNPLRAASIYNVCREIGVPLIPVDSKYIGIPLGTIAMAAGPDGTLDAEMLEKAGRTGSGRSAPNGIRGEMLLFCGMTSDEVDRFLETSRRLSIPGVDLKAVLTGTNAAWSAEKLYREIAEEHRRMHGLKS